MASLVSSLSQPRAIAQLRGQKQQQQQQKQKQAKQFRFPSLSSLSSSSSPLTSSSLLTSSTSTRTTIKPLAALKKDDDGEEKLSPSSSFPPPVPLVPVLSRSAERTIGVRSLIFFCFRFRFVFFGDFFRFSEKKKKSTTKPNQKQRTAMLGFACACVGEVLAGGGGPLSQLHLLTNSQSGAGLLPSFLLDALLAGACASVFLFSLSPVSRTWNDAVVREAFSSPRAKPPSREARAAMIEVLAGRAAAVGRLTLAVVERQTGGLGALEQRGLFARAVDGGGGGGAASTPALAGARVLLLWVAFAAFAWVTRFDDKKRG